MSDGSGDAAQLRAILGQVSEAAVIKVTAEHPELFQRQIAETPPIIRWAVGAVATFGASALIGLGIWLVSSVSTMRETLARMDERQVMNAQNFNDRFQAIDARLARLEAQKEDKP